MATTKKTASSQSKATDKLIKDLNVKIVNLESLVSELKDELQSIREKCCDVPDTKDVELRKALAKWNPKLLSRL